MSPLCLPNDILQITRPTLVLDKERVLKNIERMANKAKANGVVLRPHAKTHQSAEIGSWFEDLGVDAVAVSSVEMALYFASHGWSDIQVAFPVNILEIEAIKELAGKVSLALLVDSERAVQALDQALTTDVNLWIKVDAGYGRAGLSWSETDRFLSLVDTITDSPKLNFEGLLTHSGHSYKAAGKDDVQKIHGEVLSRLQHVQAEIKKRSSRRCRLSVGDTPTCGIVDDFTGVDEIRPGNFVFFDLMQESIGSCSEEDMAVGVACPVVGTYKNRSEIVLYGGAVHLSKDCLTGKDGKSVFGYMASLYPGSLGTPLRAAPVVSLSQEHAIVRIESPLFDQIAIGDVVIIFPVHACLTCNLHHEYRTLEGDRIPRRTC
ncbi:alanine racemase [Acidobacteriota bacterium]